MKNLKRILALLFATVLLLSCAVAFTGCNETDPTKKTYSCEFYENAFRQFYNDEFSDDLNDEAQLFRIDFLESPLQKTDIDDTFFSARIRFAKPDDRKTKALEISHVFLGEEQYFDLRDGLPADAVENNYIDGASFNCFRVEIAKLNEEDKVKLYKLCFDAYITKNPEAIELVHADE